MAFLFQVSAPGANQRNSIKAQVQHETIEPYRFLTILCSVPDDRKNRIILVILCHHFTLRISTEAYESRILSSLYIYYKLNIKLLTIVMYSDATDSRVHNVQNFPLDSLVGYFACCPVCLSVVMSYS